MNAIRYLCPNCGETLTHFTYSTYPPIRSVRCIACGYQAIENIRSIEEATFELPDGWTVSYPGTNANSD